MAKRPAFIFKILYTKKTQASNYTIALIAYICVKNVIYAFNKHTCTYKMSTSRNMHKMNGSAIIINFLIIWIPSPAYLQFLSYVRAFFMHGMQHTFGIFFQVWLMYNVHTQYNMMVLRLALSLLLRLLSLEPSVCVNVWVFSFYILWSALVSFEVYFTETSILCMHSEWRQPSFVHLFHVLDSLSSGTRFHIAFSNFCIEIFKSI